MAMVILSASACVFKRNYPKLLCALTRMWLIWTPKNTSLKKCLELSALCNMTNIQMRIAQLVGVKLTLSYFSLKAYGLVPHPCLFGRLRSSSTSKMVTVRAYTDQLSRNLTNIFQLLEAFWKIFSKFQTNWTCHTNESYSSQENTWISFPLPIY